MCTWTLSFIYIRFSRSPKKTLEGLFWSFEGIFWIVVAGDVSKLRFCMFEKYFELDINRSKNGSVCSSWPATRFWLPSRLAPVNSLLYPVFWVYFWPRSFATEDRLPPRGLFVWSVLPLLCFFLSGPRFNWEVAVSRELRFEDLVGLRLVLFSFMIMSCLALTFLKLSWEPYAVTLISRRLRGPKLAIPWGTTILLGSRESQL